VRNVTDKFAGEIKKNTFCVQLSLILWEERELRVFENMALRRQMKKLGNYMENWT